jgi:nucleotide-binding universal stress UspA family protein
VSARDDGDAKTRGGETMALKNLVVVVDQSAQSTARVNAAILLATKHDAHLTGLFVASPPVLPSYVAGELGEGIIEIQRRTAQEHADEAAVLFRRAVELAGIGDRSEWRTLRGNPTEVTGIVARYADLVIVGQVDPDRDGEVPPVHPEDVLFDCGRPVLVVPYAGKATSIGERVVIGWNASREAARAVNDALPLLETAEKVSVLAVNPKPGFDGLGDELGADIALHLARHGVMVTADHFSARGMDAGDMILNYATDVSADLLVMGAYGRSRLRELVLGGVTRHIMQHMTIPVLFSH